MGCPLSTLAVHGIDSPRSIGEGQASYGAGFARLKPARNAASVESGHRLRATRLSRDPGPAVLRRAPRINVKAFAGKAMEHAILTPGCGLPTVDNQT
jgi:hypothetical protein